MRGECGQRILSIKRGVSSRTRTTFASGQTASGSRILAIHLLRFQSGTGRAGAVPDDGERGGT